MGKSRITDIIKPDGTFVVIIEAADESGNISPHGLTVFKPGQSGGLEDLPARMLNKAREIWKDSKNI